MYLSKKSCEQLALSYEQKQFVNKILIYGLKKLASLNKTHGSLLTTHRFKMEKKRINLANLPKKNVFQTPENYFENLSSRIEARVIQSKSKGVLEVSWSARRTWLSAAACLLLLVLGWFTLQPKQDGLNPDALKGVGNQELVQYLNKQNLVEKDVVELLDNHTVTDSTMMQFLDVSEADVLKHLSENDLQDLI